MTIPYSETPAKISYFVDSESLVDRRFSVSFRFLEDPTYLTVILRKISGSQKTLTLDEHYTVVQNDSVILGWGDVLLKGESIVALDIGDEIVIMRSIPLDQPFRFSNQTIFSEVIDLALDRITAFLQDSQILPWTIHVQRDEDVDNNTLFLPSPSFRANKYLYFDESGGLSLAISPDSMLDNCLHIPPTETDVDLVMTKNSRSNKILRFNEDGSLGWLDINSWNTMIDQARDAFALASGLVEDMGNVFQTAHGPISITPIETGGDDIHIPHFEMGLRIGPGLEVQPAGVDPDYPQLQLLSATLSELGGIKILENGGLVYNDEGFVWVDFSKIPINPATYDRLGPVRIKERGGINVILDPPLAGTISLDPANDVDLGGVSIVRDGGLKITDTGALSVDFSKVTVTPATTTELGTVIIGSGIDVVTLPDQTNPVGTISLHKAKVNELGGISVGPQQSSAFSIDSEGTLSLQAATASTLGGVMVRSDAGSDSGLAIEEGVIYSLCATRSNVGAVKIGPGLSIQQDGLLDIAVPYALPPASTEDLGGIRMGPGIMWNSDIKPRVTLSNATNSTIGGIVVGRGLSSYVEEPSTITKVGVVVAKDTLGGVYVSSAPNNGLHIADGGQLYVIPATDTELGGIRIGDHLQWNDSKVDVIPPTITDLMRASQPLYLEETGSEIPFSLSILLNYDSGLYVDTSGLYSQLSIRAASRYTRGTIAVPRYDISQYKTCLDVDQAGNLYVNVGNGLDAYTGHLDLHPVEHNGDFGGVRISGDDGIEIGESALIGVPLASNTGTVKAGRVMPSPDSFTVDSSTGEMTLNPATNALRGGVIVRDALGLSVTGEGGLSVDLADSEKSKLGGVTGVTLADPGNLSPGIQSGVIKIPRAGNSWAGVVKIGEGISVTYDGTISAQGASYTAGPGIVISPDNEISVRVAPNETITASSAGLKLSYIGSRGILVDNNEITSTVKQIRPQTISGLVLLASAWDQEQTQTLNIGTEENDLEFVNLDSDDMDVWASWLSVVSIQKINGSLKFTCGEVPSLDIPVRVTVIPATPQ